LKVATNLGPFLPRGVIDGGKAGRPLERSFALLTLDKQETDQLRNVFLGVESLIKVNSV
jgi:hypothetical protein